MYRKFNIKSVDGIDDFASIEEVLERRFRRIPEKQEDTDDPWALPDLVRCIDVRILLSYLSFFAHRPCYLCYLGRRGWRERATVISHQRNVEGWSASLQ